MYFVTICTQDRAMLFGEVVGAGLVSAQMALNGAGTMAEQVYNELANSFANIVIDKYIIRDEDDYWTKWRYIDENPAKWADDEYSNLP